MIPLYKPNILTIESGKQLKTAAYANAVNQQWEIDNKMIRNRSSGLVMDIKKGSKDDGAKVISYHVQDSENQHWRLEYIN